MHICNFYGGYFKSRMLNYHNPKRDFFSALKSKEGRGDFRRFLIDFIKVAKNIVVIKKLPQPNPLIHQMSIDMSQLEDEIEFHSWNRNLPLLSQHHPIRELLLLHPLIIFLKLSVMPEAQQEARPIMHFNLHTLIRWELDVVIARLFMRRDRADKGDNPFISTFHPDINISFYLSNI